MPTPRNHLHAEDRRQQILAVATKLFAGQGFEGTTTRQIAAQARVNEAIIFRHFASKEDLYWSVIEQKCVKGRVKQGIWKRLRQKTSPREFFAAIAEDFLQQREKDPTLSRLLLYSALENHRLAQRIFRTHIANFYEVLSDYVRQQTAEGKFRRVDPVIAARGFFGMVFYHFLIQDLFGAKRYKKMDNRKVSFMLTDLWLKGMIPRDKARGDGRKSGQRPR